MTKKDFRHDCLAGCGGKMWLAPPSGGEEGIYFCEQCHRTWGQEEAYRLMKEQNATRAEQTNGPHSS